MKKKLFGMLLVAALAVTQTVTAFAAPSKETDVANIGGISSVEGADVSEDALSAVNESSLTQDQKTAVAAQFSEVNNDGKVTSIVNTLSKAEAKELKKVTVLSKVFDVQNVKAGGTATFGLSRDLSKVTSVYALHFNMSTGTWEVLPATLNGNKVTVTFTNGASPVVIVAKEKTSSRKSSSSHSSSSSDEAEAAGGEAVAAAADGTAIAVSPRTGMASDWSLWMGMAVVLLGISGVVFRRTKA